MILRRKSYDTSAVMVSKVSLSSCINIAILSSSTDGNDRPVWVIIIHPLEPVQLWEAGPLDFQPHLQQCFPYLPNRPQARWGWAHLSCTFYLPASSRLPDTTGLKKCVWNECMKNRPEEGSQVCECMPADALCTPRAINSSDAPYEI